MRMAMVTTMVTVTVMGTGTRMVMGTLTAITTGMERARDA
jgi:hypothetical protein